MLGQAANFELISSAKKSPFVSQPDFKRRARPSGVVSIGLEHGC